MHRLRITARYTRLRLTERIWLRAFGTSPKFLAPLGTSDTLDTLGDMASNRKDSIGK